MISSVRNTTKTIVTTPTMPQNRLLQNPLRISSHSIEAVEPSFFIIILLKQLNLTV